jgi:lipoprotein-releasing system permease protein
MSRLTIRSLFAINILTLILACVVTVGGNKCLEIQQSRTVLTSQDFENRPGTKIGEPYTPKMMAVFAGLERDVKDVKGRLLRLHRFTPHVLVRSPMLAVSGDEEDAPPWQDLAKETEKFPGVAAATAYVADEVILDVGSWQRPVSFRGIDTSDAVQVKGVADMLDRKNFPESSADLGLDDSAVISSIVAEQFQLQVGDTMRLYSTRNFEGVMNAYKATEKPVVREAYRDDWATVSKVLSTKWDTDGEVSTLPAEELRCAYDALGMISAEDIRDPEREMVGRLMLAMEAGEREEGGPVFRFSAEAKAEIDKSYTALMETDAEKMDSESLKGLKSLVLPKDIVVAGIYSASQMPVTPEIFVSLPLAQDLAGLGSLVQGIALRLDDPYEAEGIAAAARKSLGPDHSVETWGDQYQAFFSLINQHHSTVSVLFHSSFEEAKDTFTVLHTYGEVGIHIGVILAIASSISLFLLGKEMLKKSKDAESGLGE